MEVGWELEDDLLFADLSKRIALLIMEEEDDGGGASEELFWRRRRSEGIPFQAFAAAPPPLPEQPCGLRGIRGTGVFIPQSSLPRRKPRNGKSNHPGKPKAPAAAAAAAAKPCGHRHRKPARELRW